MEQLEQKKAFLKNDYPELLSRLNPAAERRWGKMDVPQMIEHMAEYFRIGSGKDVQPLVTPAEHIPRAQEFLKSEKPFRENTPNSLLPDTPPAPRHLTMAAALEELKEEIAWFFSSFESDPQKKVTNPFFGTLDFDMSVQLLHKHAVHHLRQFGVETIQLTTNIERR